MYAATLTGWSADARSSSTTGREPVKARPRCSSSGLYVRTNLRLPGRRRADVRLTLPTARKIGRAFLRAGRPRADRRTPRARSAGHVAWGFELIDDTPARQKLCEHIDSLRSEVPTRRCRRSPG